MNPIDHKNSVANYWLSCMLINKSAMAKQVRGDRDVCYVTEKGKTCPSEILDTLAKYNAEGRPIWKPMHLQPVFRNCPFITKEGSGRASSNAYIEGEISDVGTDIFQRGLCLPSDNKMTTEEQDKVIEIVKSCFE
jgi:dTDP-4-amino-4,6-dideoxygalactose transaminase